MRARRRRASGRRGLVETLGRLRIRARSAVRSAQVGRVDDAGNGRPAGNVEGREPGFADEAGIPRSPSVAYGCVPGGRRR